jgi:lipoate-protein ligase A
MHTSIIKDLWPADKLLSCKAQITYDEQFLEALDDSKHNNTNAIYLRFWELNTYTVVLGRSNQSDNESFEEACKARNIDILKRPSGGGTVVLGPGCLCYSLYLPTSEQDFSTIDSTNKTIMNTHSKALNTALTGIEVHGVSDLCYQGYKFSGNAQRRKKNSVLFHGTFLYDFNLDIISTLLKHPSKEPEYRQKKAHSDFVKNIPLSSDTIQTKIRQEWEKKFTVY